MDKQYDIVIIGAGPAGCMAAYKLAKHFKVLIVEKLPLPRSKSCSGVLIKRSVEIINEHFGDIPDDVKCTPYITNGITIVDESGHSQDYPDHGTNILRDRLDYWLMQKAVDAGADCIDNYAVIKIEESNGGVSITISGTEVKTVNAKIVIACDGVNGTSRKLTNTPSQDKVITYQKFYEANASIDQAKFYAYLSKDYSEYDAWINTKNNQIVIGTIAKTLPRAKHLHKRFVEFLAKEINLEIYSEIRSEAWCMPLVIPHIPVVLRKDKVFFAGEAAGLLNPFGEGISIALLSGLYLAAACTKQKSPELFDCEEIEADYRSSMLREIGHMKRQWTFLEKSYPYFWNNVMYNRPEEPLEQR